MLQITPGTEGYTQIVPAKVFRFARSLLRKGSSMEIVLSQLGGRYTAEQLAQAHAMEQLRRRVRYAFNKTRPNDTPPLPTKIIPADVQQDRDRRACLVPRDTTALRMGDPLPGCSALEKAPPMAPDIATIRRDPLDVLIFSNRKRAKVGVRFG